MTGDTELAPAVRGANRLFPSKKVLFTFPYRRKNLELMKLCPGSFLIAGAKIRKTSIPRPLSASGRHDGSQTVKLVTGEFTPPTNPLTSAASFPLVHAAEGVLREVLTPQDMAALIRYMVFSVFFCASTPTVWWFGDRALTPPSMKNN